jgi:putative ABC transport system permease protein
VLTSLRQAFRSLRRSPASALAAIVTLALTLASATAIFAVVDATLLTPPPFDRPDELVVIGEVPRTDPATTLRAVSAPTLNAWRTHTAGAVRLEGFDGTNITLTGRHHPERWPAMWVTPGFFALLGVAPRIGRGFSEADAADSTTVIVSDEFWRTKLLADLNPLGKTLVIGGQVRTIIGVLPPAFAFGLDNASLWLPLNAAPTDGAGPRVRVLGRLGGGVTAATATAQLRTAVTDQSRDLVPAVRSLNALLQGRALETMPLLLLATGLGVALAAINLAGLMMLRAMDRARELAVRAALGATRIELVKPLLIEAHVLVLIGACGGVLLALWIAPAAAQLAADQLGPAAANMTIGWRAAVALIGLALACAWLSALVPALTAARRFDLTRVGREHVSAPPTTSRVRRVLVATEIAVAFVLLAAVLLVGRSLQQVLAVAPGFVHEGVLSARLALPAARYPDGRSVAALYQQLQEALTVRLGPDRSAIVDELPLNNSSAGRIRAAIAKDAPANEVVARVAGPRYFELLHIPLVDGRTFDGRQRLDAAPAAVISASLAELLYPNTRSVGRTIWIPALGRDVEVLGVVGDVKHRALEEDTIPTVYFSAAQQPSPGSYLVLKTGRPDEETLDIVRAEVAKLDPELPLYAPQTLDHVIRTSAGVPVRRVISATFAAFALLALVIAAVGVFGIVAHDVSARRLEMALRLALGAHPRRLHRAVLRQAAAILAGGLATGLILSFFLSRPLHALLYRVAATDAITIATVTAVLSGTVLLAASLPARRAARTNPVDVLRPC